MSKRRYKKNFLQSSNDKSTKGKDKDPLVGQTLPAEKELKLEDLLAIVNQEHHTKRLCSTIPTDAIKNWIEIKFKDTETTEKNKEKVAELNKLVQKFEAKQKILDTLIDSNIYGDAGVRMLVNGPTGSPLDLSNKFEIINIIKYDSLDVERINRNEEFNSANYGEIETVEFKDPKNNNGVIIYHASKALHVQPLRRKGKLLKKDGKGTSMIQALNDVRVVLDSTFWSIGQLVYQMTMKVYKTATISKDEKLNKTREEMAERELNTRTLAMIGKDDELTSLNTTFPNNLSAGVDFIFGMIALITGIPRSKLFGNQAGALAGAGQDDTNYYDTVIQYQEKIAYKLVKGVIDVLAGQVGLTDYEVVLKPPFSLSEKEVEDIKKTRAEREKIQSETIKILMDAQALNNIKDLDKVLSQFSTITDLLEKIGD